MSAKIYRKRPLAVEAYQWKHGETEAVKAYNRPTQPSSAICRHCRKIMAKHGWIDTAKGGHRVCPGDWVVLRNGKSYPVEELEFPQLYDPL